MAIINVLIVTTLLSLCLQTWFLCDAAMTLQSRNEKTLSSNGLPLPSNESPNQIGSNSLSPAAEEELRMFLTKVSEREQYPMESAFLQRAIFMPQSNNPQESLAMRGYKRYQASPLNEQSFLRFGKAGISGNSGKSYKRRMHAKRPIETYDINDTSFLRFGRSSPIRSDLDN